MDKHIEIILTWISTFEKSEEAYEAPLLIRS